MPRPDLPTLKSAAALLNARCHCVKLDRKRLGVALDRIGAGVDPARLLETHPNLFSSVGVFVDGPTLDRMRDVIHAIERVVARPAWVEHALTGAHARARVMTRARGVFLGYDFHLSSAGPRLIEINTNAGGGLLNALLRTALHDCGGCASPEESAQGDALAAFGETFFDEWAVARGRLPLSRAAIVDDVPERQYLYPEFRVASRLLESRGIAALICDPQELAIVGGRLVHGEEPVDLVYNRLTDFMLEQPEHRALAQAYDEDLALITPHPRAHALYADKRLLVTLSDEKTLRELGASDEDAALVTAHVPRTIEVRESDRDALWSRRKSLFFKPRMGYGSRAAYRGDKLTRGVFEAVLREPYVAQDIVAPSARAVEVGDEIVELKLDIRNFVYASAVKLVAARLYQGQTTNFRTAGGGFAPVFRVG